MLKPILLGVLLVGATVAIHAAGTTAWTRLLRRGKRRWQAPLSALSTCGVLSATATWLLLLHVVEVVLWAATYRLLGELEGLETMEEAVYFSIVTFTSLGYGDVTITGPWRLLGGIEAMNGLLLFGWSTALLFAVVQRIQLAGETRGDEPAEREPKR